MEPTRPCWRTFYSLLVTAVLLLSLTASSVLRPSEPVASAASQSPAGKGVNEATVAKKLAAKEYGAHSAKARYQALVAVMRALHVGVYTRQLKAVVRGGQRAAKDFYLYDYELTILADALQQKRSDGIADIADDLSKMGLTPNGKPLDPEVLRQALISEVQAANAHKTNSMSLVPLLIRAFGLHHSQPYDLLEDVSATRLRLDPLQSFLILSDVLVPIIGKMEGGHATSLDRLRGSRHLLASAPDEPCSGNVAQILANPVFGASLAAIAAKLGLTTNVIGTLLEKGLAADLAGLGATASGGIIGVFLVDLIHLALLEWDIRVYQTPATSTDQATHYGPPGHPSTTGEPGRELRFTVRVIMQGDVNHFIVNCGALVGFQVPPPGPISGVSVVWTDFSPTSIVPVLPITGRLGSYGTVEFPGGKKTDGNGEATAVFTPNTEIVPGFGQEVTASGYYTAFPLYQQAFGSILGINLTGSLTQFLGANAALFSWKVSRHAPRGFKFEGVHLNWQPYDYYVTDSTHGRICGETPYGAWSISTTVTNNIDPTNTGTVDYMAALSPDSHEGSGIGTFGAFYHFTFVPGPPAQMVVTSRQVGAEQQATVPVTEDTDCPAPTP